MASLKLTDESFEKEVLHADTPVLVDFWAEWCQPCLMVDPVVEELSEEFGDRIKFGKMNVDENIQVPGNFGIMSIPTLIVFKGGKPDKTFVGVQGKDTLKQALQDVLQN